MMMIGNCFFPLERQYSKNEEYVKYFLIFSAKLKSKEREMGKNGMKLQENYRVMGNVQHITRFLKGMDKNLSPCKWGMARPSLRPVEEYKERFNFAQYRIHHNRANRLPVR